MSKVTLAKAKENLSALLNQVEAGEEIVITRRGHAVARLLPMEKPKKPIESLAGFRSQMPRWRKPSANLLRDLRDEDS